MNQPVRQCLLATLFIILLSAGGVAAVGTDSPMNQPDQTGNDTMGGQVPALPQIPDIKFHEAGAPPELPGNSAGVFASEEKERIKVIYDPATEKDRGTMITLVIAFGISLALNIYLATSLLSARKGMM